MASQPRTTSSPAGAGTPIGSAWRCWTSWCWTIETAHQEAKAHGVGQARNRVRAAVQRTVPFGFLAQAITIAWYARHGDPDADLDARRPVYRQKATISYSDMLAALRRELIRHEYWAQAPAATGNSQTTQTPSP